MNNGKAKQEQHTKPAKFSTTATSLPHPPPPIPLPAITVSEPAVNESGLASRGKAPPVYAQPPSSPIADRLSPPSAIPKDEFIPFEASSKEARDKSSGAYGCEIDVDAQGSE